MTLLEVLVALTVAGVALTAGASTLGFLTDQQSRAGMQALSSAYAVRTTLRDWIAGAQLSTQGDAEFKGAPRRERMEKDDELTFVTSTPTDVATTGTIVHVYVEHDERHSPHGLIAELSPWRKKGEPKLVLLAAGANSLGIRYLGSVFGDRKWLPRWSSSPVLPAAVELRIGFDDPPVSDSADRAATAVLALPMTIALGARR